MIGTDGEFDRGRQNDALPGDNSMEHSIVGYDPSIRWFRDSRGPRRPLCRSFDLVKWQLEMVCAWGDCWAARTTRTARRGPVVCDVATRPPITNGSPRGCYSTPVDPSVSDRGFITRYHNYSRLGTPAQGGQSLVAVLFVKEVKTI
ncbi:hypothetical protein F4813DRAFT_359225 [Daldinia decipiens]|uniref:uncharacterized protein n=1 Tax=Daldinia decipiens TaxID=326647 RepID=UPI0020C3D3BB|nr:uncharacterized protein F4813DRAFT_359225 [Daldinia decipiens]KAI1657663.1 hypothetical protein F4813DRAFT_359225 [Daldinia decipiens]